MPFLILIVLVVLHWLGIKKIGKKLEGYLGMSQFKAKTLLVPLDIGVTALFIWLTPLSFLEAGLIGGDAISGLRSLLILGTPLALLTSALVFLGSGLRMGLRRAGGRALLQGFRSGNSVGTSPGGAVLSELRYPNFQPHLRDCSRLQRSRGQRVLGRFPRYVADSPAGRLGAGV